MTREEAIKRLKDGAPFSELLDVKWEEAINIAIEALKAEPCEDAVSRQAVLALAKDVVLKGGCKHRCIDTTQIYELPSVTPKQRTGHWIMTSDYITTAYGSIDYVKCSCCHEDSLEEGKHCPNCGAKMREVSE